MSIRKNGITILGLCLVAALGMLALAASAAQAEGEFKIEGKTLTELKITEESLEGKAAAGEAGLYKLLIGALNLTILCTAVELRGAARILPGGVIHAITLYLNCTAREDKAGEAEIKSCTVTDTEAEAMPGMFSITLLGNVVTLGASRFLIVKPSVGTTLATIVLKGESCALPEKTELKGTYAAAIGTEAKELSLTSVGAKLEEELKVGLTFGKNKATVSGTTLEELTGSHKGQKWGVV